MVQERGGVALPCSAGGPRLGEGRKAESFRHEVTEVAELDRVERDMPLFGFTEDDLHVDERIRVRIEEPRAAKPDLDHFANRVRGQPCAGGVFGQVVDHHVHALVGGAQAEEVELLGELLLNRLAGILRPGRCRAPRAWQAGRGRRSSVPPWENLPEREGKGMAKAELSCESAPGGPP